MFGNLFNQRKNTNVQAPPPGQGYPPPDAGQQPQMPGGYPPQSQQPYDQSSGALPAQPMPPPTGGYPPQSSAGAQQGMQPPMSMGPNPAAPSKMADPAMRQNLSALSHLDQRSTQVLTHAQEETKRIRQALIEPDQLLLGLLYDEEIFKLLHEFSVDIAKLQKEIQSKEQVGSFVGIPTFSENTKQVFEQAYLNAKNRSASFVSPEDILLVLLSPNVPTATTLQTQGVRKDQVEQKLTKSTSYTSAKKSVLERFGIDLTNEAREGKLDPVTGRDKEIERLIHILLRRTKNNPIIIGEAGVGKTAIIEGLAQQIVAGTVPKDLLNKRIFQLDMASLVAGASHRGEFEERLKSVITETMASAGQTILFIDEIHTLMGAGDDSGGMDASNIIKPHLARGHMQIIGTTTTTEYRKYFEKDKAFERRFQPIIAEEPSEENAMKMLEVLKPKFEQFHHVVITEDAIEAAVKLSKKYIGERYLPDKAVDLLDEAAAEVKLAHSEGKGSSYAVNNAKDAEQKPQSVDDGKAQVVGQAEDAKVTTPTQQQQGQQPVQQPDQQVAQQPGTQSTQQPDQQQQANAPQESHEEEKPGIRADNEVKKSDIENVVSNWTGIPITKLTEDEGQKLMHLEDRIHQRLIDQEEAVVAVAEAVRRGRIGLASGKRPIASFIFLGPSGTGKTELAKTLAEILFGRDDAMIRLDMSEYMEKHEVAKLIGAPPGYVGYEEGGQLTEAVRAKPYSIVLLDEVEKAHPDVFNILLQLLEDGRLTDNKGNTISFKNTIVICTSNIGSALITQKLSETEDKNVQKPPEQEEKDFEELNKLVSDELRKFFRPELLNRYDDIVIFKPLRRQDMHGIAKLGIDKTAKLLKEQGYTVQITDKALSELAKDGYDPMYGARPLRRLIQTDIENPVAMEIISGKFHLGDTIVIDYDGEKSKYTFLNPAGQAHQAADTQQETQQPNPADPNAAGQQGVQAPGTPSGDGQVPPDQMQGNPIDPNAPQYPPPPPDAGVAMNMPDPNTPPPAGYPDGVPLGYQDSAQAPVAPNSTSGLIPPAYDPNQQQNSAANGQVVPPASNGMMQATN